MTHPNSEQHRETAQLAFNDDMIRRNDLPADAMALIHDIAYHHEGRDETAGTPEAYVHRAQEILKRTKSPHIAGYSSHE